MKSTPLYSARCEGCGGVKWVGVARFLQSRTGTQGDDGVGGGGGGGVGWRARRG
jgi:hypothetical protein